MSLTHPSSSNRRRPATVIALIIAAALAFGTLAFSATPAEAKSTKKAAKVAISKVKASGKKVTVTGTVRLPSNLKNTAKNRKRVKVALTLTNSAGKKQSFTAKVTSKRKFTARKTTTLTGKLKLTAQVRVKGKASGKRVTKKNAVTIAAPRTTTPTPTPTPTTPPTYDFSIPDGAVKLDGLFGFDAGQDDASGKIWGTYFRMQDGAGGYFTNDSSTARNKTYTLLRPGTDGGLLTTEYQEPPDPAFDGTVNGTGFLTGNALANRITLPQKFFGVGFSISTAPTDAQAEFNFDQEVASPLPQIYEKDGKLYGQVTGWTASWNGSWFNQGSPKPAGTPAGYPATPVSGTYDADTGHYTLHWTSRIYGGAFQGAWGHWYLEGTYTPAT